MPESKQNETEGQDAPKRRASDRGVPEQGTHGGGRRFNDNHRTLPRSKVARVAIACSFFFSTGLLAWAFTLPFRSGGIGDGVATADLTEAELMKLEYEARLSPAAYVEYGRDIDRRMLDQYRNRQQANDAGPSKAESYRSWKAKAEKRRRTINALRQGLGQEEEDFLEGTVEWQFEKDMEKVITDAPPEPGPAI